MSNNKFFKIYIFQKLSTRQWCWLWVAYWRLWAALIRIKFKQLFGGMDWLAKKITVSGAQVKNGASNSTLGLEMHESVRLAARLHFYHVECLPKSIVLADMLRERNMDALLVIGVNKDGKALSSHAWVELDGMVIAEPDSIHQDFTALKH